MHEIEVISRRGDGAQHHRSQRLDLVLEVEASGEHGAAGVEGRIRGVQEPEVDLALVPSAGAAERRVLVLEHGDRYSEARGGVRSSRP